MAGGLAAAGVAPGDRVGIYAASTLDWVLAYLGVQRAGGCVVPMNPDYHASEAQHILTDSDPTLVIADAPRAEIVESLGRRVIPLDDLPNSSVPPMPVLTPDSPAAILYTSGTTGRPKGAHGSQRNIMSNLISIGFSGARAIVRRTGELPPPVEPDAPQKSMLLPVPLFHVTGCHSMLVPAMAGGSKMVFMQRWSPERALELIEAEKINGTTGVPTMIWQLLESPDFPRRDLSSIEAISYGGAAAAPELTEKVKALFPHIWPGQGYGATETSSVATANAAEDYLTRPDSVGLAVPVDDVRIEDAEGNVLPPGGVGEICIFGPNVVRGYWNRPEATLSAFVDGWYHTGDVGRMDAEGFIYVMDRIKDMLIRGGENIYCVEIEDALYAHPAVMDAAVVGIPHRTLGEEVAAVVRLRPGAAADEAELRGHVRKLLSAYKVPVRIDIRDEELPRNANGKTMKSVIREQMLAGVAN